MTQSDVVRAGIDIGGTFTDAVQIDRDGNLRVAKVKTTPDDFARGFGEALDSLGAVSGLPASAIGYLVHGTTVATNAIVQNRVARVGLLTTGGFRDVLEIGTQLRPSIYDMHQPKPDPLVPRELRLEVGERIGPEGQVIRPLRAVEVEEAARAFADSEVEAVAVCMLFSFVNPAHEEEAGAILERLLPGIPVTLSSRVAPEFREYQRASTTALNASLLPLVGSYVGRLDEALSSADSAVPLHLMQSNGGVATAATAATLPVGLIASGPAAGVIGGARIASGVGVEDALTFDMGGTTADVGLVVGGKPQLRYEGEAAGHPVNLPQVDVLSVGSGGGSIARVDDFGALRVGPESAGADPGPAAYGAGGREATVTDAHVVLGTLDPERFLGGRMKLDRDAATEAIRTRVAEPLDLSPDDAAAAVLRLADATMAGALRVVSVARGHDPRRLGLVGFGGAGPMHSFAIADQLGIDRVVIPRFPGVSSALGLLLADMRHDLRRTWIRRTGELGPGELDAALDELGAEGRAVLAEAGFTEERVEISRELDMRYRGQAYELTVPVEDELSGTELVDAAESSFHAAHERTYGHSSPVEEIEIVTLRLHVSVGLGASGWSGGEAASAAEEEREVWVPGEGRVSHRVIQRSAMASVGAIDGPALIEQDDSTVLVPSGWRLEYASESALIGERRS